MRTAFVIEYECTAKIMRIAVGRSVADNIRFGFSRRIIIPGFIDFCVFKLKKLCHMHSQCTSVI